MPRFLKSLSFLSSPNKHHHAFFSPTRTTTSFLSGKITPQQTKRLSSTSTKHIVDLRSDTVTLPSRPMLECSLTAQVGDDVYGEDPTVSELEEYVADMFQKEKALYLPTCTMANLVGIMSHCRERASEIIVGANSHISLWEGANISNLAGISSRQIPESANDATISLESISSNYKTDTDDHTPKTELICLENTHNQMGGVALPTEYISEIKHLANSLDVKVHLDGARIFHAAVALRTDVRDLCRDADSVSICLSKGLGAPLGSLLVGETEFIRLAKRARKRCGGGMRQAGVVASMGMYALKNNVERLAEDHERAKRLARELNQFGFPVARDGIVDTNIVYFGLPEDCVVNADDVCERLEVDHGVKIGSGYRIQGSELLRAVTHMDVEDEGIERAIEGLLKVC